MGSLQNRRVLRSAWLAAAAVGAMAPAMAEAQDIPGPEIAEQQPQVIVNNALSPIAPAPGALDTGVNGIGQMIAIVPVGVGAGLSLCSGTLINPRTVIFAAHCVNARPASHYGSTTGTQGGINNVPNLANSRGVPLSFGFSATNRCLGVAVNGCVIGTGPYERWRDTAYSTQTANNIFNVNQIWYDPRSLEPASASFLYADIAMATLDTPASDIPTWALLFSPLTGPTHATITGYGINGTHTSAQGVTACTFNVPPGDFCRPRGGIDFRRRAAENMIDILASLDDLDEALFPGDPRNGTDNPQALYQTDFDSPGGPGTFNGVNNFDIDLFDGAALPREGTTAGGDSGGPLIADQAFARPVVIGTLSGGSRYFNGQRFATYGTTSFYQPLFLFWEEIVANNPYVYAGNKAGNGQWTDPGHWVQLMDPVYQVSSNGALANGLPDFFADENAGNGPRFGTVCNGPNCVNLAGSGTPLETSPTPIIVPGGPGSTNFVPNNIDPINSNTPGQTVRARYYDVTLSAAGSTRLGNAGITIDKLTIDGPTRLDVQSTGSLRVLGDYYNLAGATHVDGLIKSGEALFVTGLLSGNGTFDPTFLTSVAAVIAPGALNGTGTLTIQGDVVLASASTLVLDVNRDRQDKLVILGDAQNTGAILLGGTVFFQKNGAAPRHGQSFEIVTAAGGVRGTFDNVATFQGIGVLRPELSYLANAVSVDIRAGSVKEYIGPGAGGTAIAFAGALDALRGSSYNSLHGLYGTLDLMDPASLSFALNGLSPRIVNETTALHDRQSATVVTVIGDRLAKLGTAQSQAGTLTVVGSPETLVPGFVYNGSTAAQKSFVNGIVPQQTVGALPETMSGFISGGYEFGRAALARSNLNGTTQRSWHMAAGLEMEVSDRATLGTAFGFASGSSRLTGSNAEIDTSQAAFYGSYRFGGGFYAAGLASMAQSRIGVQRRATVGLDAFDLRGDTTATNYQLRGEAGVNLPLAQGVTFTPKASLGYSRYDLSGFRENGGETALRIDDYSQARVEARAGFAVSGETGSAFGWRLAPQLTAEWVNAIGGGTGEMKVRFAAAEGESFLLPGFAFDRSYGDVKGGLKLTKGPVSLGVAVQTSVARSDFRDDRGVADFTLRF